jgi:hypothetical protein
MPDPVQSIRVATTLAERFGAIIRRANSMVSGSVAELELMIGESQQIYPEIWRHLDEARTVLVERDVDVSSFDILRRGELVLLGVSDIDSRTEINYMALMVGRLSYSTVKTATFNAQGYQRAVAACKALMAAMPEVDWVAIAKKEDQEIAAAGSLQSGKYVGIVKWVAIAAALGGVGVGAYKLFTRGGDPEENARREKYQAEATEQIALREQVAKRHRDLVEAREQYIETCSDLARGNYARVLRDDSQPTEAQRVLTEPCRPKPPRCSEGRDAAQTHIQDKFELQDLPDSDDYVWRCAGGFFGPGKPGLVVALTSKDKANKKKAVRGIVQRDGQAEYAAYAVWPHEISAIDAGDLDADGTDEVVTVYAQGVTVSRFRDGKLVDVADLPVLGIEPTGHACTGSIELVADPEKPKGSRLIINVDDGAKGKDCPKPGYHSFVLEGDKLVDAAPPE